MYDYRRNSLTVEEAAKLLGVRPNTLRGWVNNCGLEANRVGPIILIPRSKLQKWVREDYPRMAKAGKVRVRIDVKRLGPGW